MPKVKVKVFGAGSLEVEGPTAKMVFDCIITDLKLRSIDMLPVKVHIVKRGPKKKAKALSVDSEVETTD